MAMLRDISARKRSEELTRQMAYYDLLTGLPNRALFSDRLGVALAHARRYRQKMALMMLDLDCFKEINDSLGHKVGDLVLQEVGARLGQLLRRSDTVARYGGDEFTIINTDISRVRDSAKIAQKIRAAFQKPFICEGREIQVSASLGVAIYPDDSRDAEGLLRRADDAMYRAKRARRNRPQRCPLVVEALGGAPSPA
jgi:diguanylate cyclase (GGDEF)-like protein